MSNFTSPSSSASMRSPINWRLESFKKCSKGGGQAYPTLKHPTSSAEVGTPTPAGGEEDHQPHPKTQKNPNSPMDDGTPNKPDIPTVFLKSRHDDGPTSRKPMPEIKLDDPSQDMDKSHLSDSTSSTSILNETCSLDTSCNHLLQLDSPSLSSELLDTSSVESVEIEFVPDFE